MNESSEQTDWSPFDPDEDDVQQRAIAQLLHARSVRGCRQRVLDLGCGDGRILRPLLAFDIDVVGVDHDRAAIASCDAFAGASDGPGHLELHECDMLELPASLRRGSFDIVLCVGNTAMTLLHHDQLDALFRQGAEALSPGGLMLLDDFPFTCWRELVEGNWVEGLSDDASMQMLWRAGEPVFTIRSGHEVDPENWTIGDNERCYRLWAMSDLVHASTRGGFTSGERRDDDHLLVFQCDR